MAERADKCVLRLRWKRHNPGVDTSRDARNRWIEILISREIGPSTNIEGKIVRKILPSIRQYAAKDDCRISAIAIVQRDTKAHLAVAHLTTKLRVNGAARGFAK